MTWSAWEIHARTCTQCRDALTGPPKPFRPDRCRTYIEEDDEDPPVQCPHPPSAGGPFCEHHPGAVAGAIIRYQDPMTRIRETGIGGTTNRAGQPMAKPGKEVRT
jgi:hypothetical protein